MHIIKAIIYGPYVNNFSSLNDMAGTIWNRNLSCIGFLDQLSLSAFIVPLPEMMVLIMNANHMIGIVIVCLQMIYHIIRPNRINLPSTRSQWRINKWEKGKINLTGGAVTADLFYGHSLLNDQKDVKWFLWFLISSNNHFLGDMIFFQLQNWIFKFVYIRQT